MSQADMDIFVPAAASLDIASKRGDVTIEERKADVKIALQHGDVTLTEIVGAGADQPGERLDSRQRRLSATSISAATWTT